MPRVRLGGLLLGLTVVALAIHPVAALPAFAATLDVRSSPAPVPPTLAPPTPSEATPTPLDPDPRQEPGGPSGESPSEASPSDLETGDVAGEGDSARRGRKAAAVTVADNEFRPPQLTVTVGTKVVWTLDGQNPHTVTADDRAFDSGTLESGNTFSVTFDEVGRVPYYCQIHGEPGSGMFGVVIVRAPEEQEDPSSPASGSNDLPRTGLDPIPLALAALGLTMAGLLCLRRVGTRPAEEVTSQGARLDDVFTEEKGKR